jgi:hypothetical protein
LAFLGGIKGTLCEFRANPAPLAIANSDRAVDAMPWALPRAFSQSTDPATTPRPNPTRIAAINGFIVSGMAAALVVCLYYFNCCNLFSGKELHVASATLTVSWISAIG